MKKLTSLAVALMLILSCFAISAVSAEDTDYSYKMYPLLIERLSTAFPDDELKVSLWLEDIDHDAVNDRVVEELGYGKVEVENSNWNSLSPEEKVEWNKKVDDYIAAERRISSEMQLEKTREVLEILKIDEANCLFISKYSPLIILTTTPAELNELIKSEHVYSADLITDNAGWDDAATPSDDKGTTFTTTKDGITFSLTYDKSVYTIGGYFTFNFYVKNDNDYTIYVPGMPAADFWFTDILYTDKESGKEYKYGQGGEATSISFKVEPGENKAYEYQIFCNPKNFLYNHEETAPNFMGDIPLKYVIKYGLSDPENGPWPYVKDHEIALDTTIKVAEKIEDLYASSVTADATVQDGGEANISALIRNPSEDDINEMVDVEYYIDNRLVETVRTRVIIEAGKYTLVTSETPHEFYFGKHTIRAAVKFANQNIYDEYEENNSIKSKLLVTD
jgi:hypothetical protein